VTADPIVGYQACAGTLTNYTSLPCTKPVNQITAPQNSFEPGVFKYVYTIRMNRTRNEDGVAADTFVFKRDPNAYNYASPFLAVELACGGMGTPVRMADGITVQCAIRGHDRDDMFEIWVARPRRTSNTAVPMGCSGSGNGYGDRVAPDPPCRDGGIRKGLAIEFDTFYDQNQRDPRQGLRHWWINATEIVSFSDNHVGVFLTPDPFVYPNHGLSADHSNDPYHYAATPSIPNLSDGNVHTVKVQYFRGFRTAKRQGQGKLFWSSSCPTPPCTIFGDSATKFTAEIKYTDKITTYLWVDGTEYPVANTYTRRITNDTTLLVSRPPTTTVLSGAAKPYSYYRDYPGYLTIFIDDMSMFALRVAITDSEMAAALDMNGNAYMGMVASTGSLHQSLDILNWQFCNHLGCVPI